MAKVKANPDQENCENREPETKMAVQIEWDKGQLHATLADTPSARALYESLPVSASASTWGKEVYFGLSLNTPKEADASDVVQPGAICYWFDGRALALPFGPTPISEGNECRLAGEVNVLGYIKEDPNQLGSVRDGARITLRKVA